jgi:hypothetical protein
MRANLPAEQLPGRPEEIRSQHQMADSGVVYIATGESFIREAEMGAARLKTVMPGVSVALISDGHPHGGMFDIVIHTTSQKDIWRWKIETIALSPFQRTIFLDTDTYVCLPLWELFDALSDFPMAVAPESSLAHVHPNMPEYLFGYNTGVLCFRSCPEWQHFHRRWLEIYDDYARADRTPRLLIHDQPAFHEAVHKCPLRFLELPPQYNFRGVKMGVLHKPVKILHFRPSFYVAWPAVMQLINETQGWPKIFIANRVFARSGRDDYYKVGNVLNATLGKPWGPCVQVRRLLARFFGSISRNIWWFAVKIRNRGRARPS